MSKSVWITMIKKDEARAQAIYKTVSEYGLGVEGHFWRDDLENMEWSGAIAEIAKKHVSPRTGESAASPVNGMQETVNTHA